MFYGQLESGENVFADKNLIGKCVFCPLCQKELRIKKSTKGRYFFVHYKKCQKDYGEGSKHLFWKRHIMKCLFEKDAKEEVVFANRRRGDIYIEKESSVIEIQFSTISKDELSRRIFDYEALNFKQFWLFQWPAIKKELLTLAPMMIYIWKNTDLPLIYIDDKKRCLRVVTMLQFVNNRNAFCEYQTYSFEEILKIRRLEYQKSVAIKLQKKWMNYHKMRQPFFYEKNKRYRTKISQQLYYLSSKGVVAGQVGKGYTGNIFFVTSPEKWQVECLYLLLVCKKTVEECSNILQRQMIRKSPPAVVIVKQVLEQFLAKPFYTQ